MDVLQVPVAPDATPYDIQNLPAPSMIFVVCEICNGQKYLLEDDDE